MMADSSLKSDGDHIRVRPILAPNAIPNLKKKGVKKTGKNANQTKTQTARVLDKRKRWMVRPLQPRRQTGNTVAENHTLSQFFHSSLLQSSSSRLVSCFGKILEV